MDRVKRYQIEVRSRRTPDGGWACALRVPLAGGRSQIQLGTEVPGEALEGLRHVLCAALAQCHRELHAQMDAERRGAAVGCFGPVIGWRERRAATVGELAPYPWISGSDPLCDSLTRFGAYAGQMLERVVPGASPGLAAGLRCIAAGMAPSVGYVGFGEGLAAQAGQSALDFLGRATQPVQEGFQQFGEVLSGERDPATGMTRAEQEAAADWGRRVAAPAIAILRDPSRSPAERAAARRVLLAGDPARRVGGYDPGSSQLRGWTAEGEGTAAPFSTPGPGYRPPQEMTATAPIRRETLAVPLLEYGIKAPASAYTGPTPESVAWAQANTARIKAAEEAAVKAAPGTPASSTAGPLPNLGTLAATGGAAAAPYLAGGEVLAQSLNVLLSVPSLRAQLDPEIASTLATALRAVETRAGAALGSERARAVLAHARQQTAGKLARALQITNLLMQQ